MIGIAFRRWTVLSALYAINNPTRGLEKEVCPHGACAQWVILLLSVVGSGIRCSKQHRYAYIAELPFCLLSLSIKAVGSQTQGQRHLCEPLIFRQDCESNACSTTRIFTHV